MLREKAFDFWKTYIGLMTKGGVDVSMTNPAVTFTADAKAGEYDDISDEEYYELLDFTEELASFWKKNREATAGAVLLEALVNTDLSLSETDKLAQILAEASERKTYKYIKPEPEFETTFDKTPFDEGEVEWTPQMIYEYLDENVYRQENAKKAAAIMLYNHLKGRRRNMILAGPTGCGKTEIWRSLQKRFPFIKIVNGPQIACDGWKGSYHVKDIFLEEPAEKVKKMLIVIDEADKLFEPSIGSAGVDYSRKIQNEFLKIMDGDKVDFVSEGNDAKKTTIDCSHVSFVFCGSFETLLQNREDKPAAIGFFQSVASDEEEDSITIEDLVEYGNVRREIAGRIQQIVALNALTVDDFVRILETRVFGGEKWYAKRDVKAKRPDSLLSGHHIGSGICAYAKLPESSWRYSGGRGLELIFGSSDYRFHATLFYLAYSNRSDSTAAEFSAACHGIMESRHSGGAACVSGRDSWTQPCQ